MKLSKHDIGGELISILTKGMYADPKDALREYIQNGIDANAKKISIKVRPDNIVVSDDGKGMDKIIMRRSIRIGISDKNPSKNVGFMGIGIYSSFHLCDELTIYSKVKNALPNKLTFRFKEMRDHLDEQKNIRIVGRSKIQQQIDLQSLLEKNIDFISLANDSFPNEGTRIEMSGIEPNFFKSLSKFDEIGDYLESVVPLPFSEDFTPGLEIQDHINLICKKHKTSFKVIDLFLNLNGADIQLFRPYKDADFVSPKSKGSPLPPQFYEMKSSEGFLGIAWACLNSQRDTIPNDKVRGFIIKKQGFSIGKRSDLIPHFGRTTYFNRAVGEFLVLHPKLLPNAPRSDFEYSSLRTSFYGELKVIAKKFSEYADGYQEYEKAENDLVDAAEKFNEMSAQLDFFETNSDKLLEYFGYLTNTISSLDKKLKSNRFRKEKEKQAQTIINKMNALRNEIKSLIDNKKNKKKSSKKSSTKSARKFVNTESPRSNEPVPEELTDIIYSLGFELSDDLSEIVRLIDEKFIKSNSSSKDDYQEKLIDLRNDIENLFEEE
ncbi:MAG TPA: primosomal replication protein PriC [Puia sp.]|jgi:hypothetical protein|nr:primosomal replication protein PriC [Puia sp.]